MSWQKVRAGTLMIAAGLCGGLAALGSGCGLAPYDCADWAECPPEGPACPGQCIPLPPLEFNGPALLWIGRESEAPACPERAPRNVYEGHADLDASYQCAPCECSQPACELPGGVTASDSAGCQGPSFTTLDAPAQWDGSCVSPATVSTPGSVLIAPPTVRACAPIVEEPPQNIYPPSPWGTFARACAGEAIPGVCGDPGLTCLPTAEPPPPGFQQCIMHLEPGERDCPAEFPEPHLLYGDLDDTRTCTQCQCVQSTPSDCAALVSVYQDQACNSLVVSSMITSAPLCVSVAQGVSLAGIEASWLINDPGSCITVGGEPIGEATPIEPRTFCCQPPPR